MRSKKNAVFAYDATTMFLPDDRFTFGREPTLRRMPDGSLISFVYTGGHGEPDPDNVVTIIEGWACVECLKKHLASPHMLKYKEDVKNLVKGTTLNIVEPA